MICFARTFTAIPSCCNTKNTSACIWCIWKKLSYLGQFWTNKSEYWSAKFAQKFCSFQYKERLVMWHSYILCYGCSQLHSLKKNSIISQSILHRFFWILDRWIRVKITLIMIYNTPSYVRLEFYMLSLLLTATSSVSTEKGNLVAEKETFSS